MLLETFFAVSWLWGLSKANTFPSLITTNATIAIVIDREFLANEYDNIKTSIEEYVVYAKREILRHGGVNVQFYSWTSINVKRDLTAILSIASCSDTWRLFHAADEERILHMAISEADCPRLPVDVAVTVPLISRGEELPQLLLDLRSSAVYKATSEVVLYDTTVSRDMATRVIQALTRESGRGQGTVTLLRIAPNTTTSTWRDGVLAAVASVNMRRVGGRFVAIVGADLVETVMELAKVHGLVTTKTQWLYVVSDTDRRTDNISRYRGMLREGDNVAFVYNSTLTRSMCVGGLRCHSEELSAAFMSALDEAIESEFDLAEQVSDEEWEAIRPTKAERRSLLLEKIRKQLLEYGKCNNCTKWGLQTGETWGREYQQNSTGALLLQVGTWRPSDGFSLVEELFPHIAHGFRGKTLPMVSFHNPPWQILKTNESGQVVEYGGLVFDIVRQLADSLNFTFVVTVPAGGLPDKQRQQLGGGAVNNRTTGAEFELTELVTNSIPETVSGMVRNKSAAVGACAFTITERSKHLVNFTIPISVETHTFLVARPRELSRALLFMSPFAGDTWLCLCAAIISMGPLLYYIHRYSPMYEYRGIRMKGGLSSIQNCIWYMYGALLQQGGMHLPDADSARILVGAWWLVVLVIATTYCGNLVAFLTFPKIDVPITTIEELLAHRDTVSWSFTKHSYLEDQLKVAPEQKFRQLYEGRVDIPKDKKMIEMIENGKHVFIDWKMRLQHIMKKQYLEADRCDLALGLDEFIDEKIAMIVAVDNPYLTTINDEIRKLHQVGLIQKWMRDYLPRRDRCWKNRRVVEVNNHTVNMDDMQGSFFVLFIGFVLAFLLIALEKLWHRYKKKKELKVIQPFTT